MTSFEPTHRIILTPPNSEPEEIPVMLSEEYSGSGGSLLTEEEWATGERPEWALDENGHLYFHGEAVPRNAATVTLERLRYPMPAFLSAVAFKDAPDTLPALCMAPEYTDSWDDLIALRSDSRADHPEYVRIELRPTLDDYANVDGYIFRVAEVNPPAWFSVEPRLEVDRILRDHVRAMILTDERELLLGGCWILGDGARIRRVRNARIVAMQGTAHIDCVEASSRISLMRDSARITTLRDRATVGALRDGSWVDCIRDSATILNSLQR